MQQQAGVAVGGATPHGGGASEQVGGATTVNNDREDVFSTRWDCLSFEKHAMTFANKQRVYIIVFTENSIQIVPYWL